MRIASNRAEEFTGAVMSLNLDCDEWCMLVHDVVEAWAWAFDSEGAAEELAFALEQMPETSLVRQGPTLDDVVYGDDPDLVYEMLCEAMGYLLEQALIEGSEAGEALLLSLLEGLDAPVMVLLHEDAMDAYTRAWTSIEEPIDRWVYEQGHLDLSGIGLTTPCPWQPSPN